ncbi:hypothetical protein, partial [Ferroplasma acidiphilum]
KFKGKEINSKMIPEKMRINGINARGLLLTIKGKKSKKPALASPSTARVKRMANPDNIRRIPAYNLFELPFFPCILIPPPEFIAGTLFSLSF